jgi:hypothetical protein
MMSPLRQACESESGSQIRPTIESCVIRDYKIVSIQTNNHDESPPTKGIKEPPVSTCHWNICTVLLSICWHTHYCCCRRRRRRMDSQDRRLPKQGLSTAKIVVCQNKDCRQRWQLQTPLPEVLHDLLSGSSNRHDFSIETTSCFSQCGQGPNVCITVPQPSPNQNGELSREVYLNGLSNAIAVSAELELLSLPVPSKLLAAVNVLERALNGKSPSSCLPMQSLNSVNEVWIRSAASFYRVANNCINI